MNRKFGIQVKKRNGSARLAAWGQGGLLPTPLRGCDGDFLYTVGILKRGRAAMRKTEQHHPTIMRLPVDRDLKIGPIRM